MGSLTKPIILVVVIYLLLKFVVPNVPGSAPLPSSLIFLYLMLTAVRHRHLLHDERRIEGRVLGADSAVPHR